MKYNEETFKEEVAKIYNGEIKIVGKYKGLTHPILCEDKYGVMQIIVPNTLSIPYCGAI